MRRKGKILCFSAVCTQSAATGLKLRTKNTTATGTLKQKRNGNLPNKHIIS